MAFLAARIQACNVALGTRFAALPGDADSRASAIDQYVSALTSYAANELDVCRTRAQAAIAALDADGRFAEALCLHARLGALASADVSRVLDQGLELASSLNAPVLADRLALPMLSFEKAPAERIKWVAHWPPHPGDLDATLRLLAGAGELARGSCVYCQRWRHSSTRFYLNRVFLI
jgi:hypothetical protein